MRKLLAFALAFVAFPAFAQTYQSVVVDTSAPITAGHPFAPCTTGSATACDGSAITATSGTTATTAQDVANRVLSTQDFGSIGSSESFTTALNAEIDACGTRFNVGRTPAGTFSLTAELHPILNSNCTMDLTGTWLQFPSTVSSGFHQAFWIGDDTHNPVNSYWKNFKLTYLNSPTANGGYAMGSPQATYCGWINGTIVGATGILHLGDAVATSVPQICLLENINGTIGATGLNDAYNVLDEGSAVIRFNGWNFTGNGTCSTNATGALNAIIPATGKFVDTYIRDKWGMQCFSGNITDGSGKPYGDYKDDTNGPIYNLWDTNSFIDHTTVCSDYLTSSGGGTGYYRSHFSTGRRITPDAGQALCGNFQSGTLVRDIQYTSPKISTNGTGNAVQIQGSNVANFNITSPIIGYIGNASRTAAFEVDTNGVSIRDWSIGDSNSTGQTLAEALLIGSASVTDVNFDCGNVNGATTLTAFTSEPTYSTANSYQRRICRGSPPLFAGTFGGATIGALGNLCVMSTSGGIGSPASTSASTLYTCTLPANTLDTVGREVLIDACFLHGATTNNVVSAITFGSTTRNNGGVSTSGQGGCLYGRVIKTGASAQNIIWWGLSGVTGVAPTMVTASNTDTSAINIIFTSTDTAGVANDDMLWQFDVRYAN